MTSHFKEWMRATAAARRVLLVEDSLDECQLIQNMSKGFNVEWVIAHNYGQTLEKFELASRDENHSFRLVVLDLNLSSEPDGVGVFRWIKRNHPSVPVLVLSGYINSDVVSEMTEVGFVMFALKPKCYDHKFFSQLFLALNIPRLSPGTVTNETV